ncbi:MAG: hypothetical protein AB4057_00325 [Crocosphaera sp.]
MNYDEEARSEFIDGQNDALIMINPLHPDSPYYMMGWQNTQDKLSKGDPQVCKALINAIYEALQPIEDNWEEF